MGLVALGLPHLYDRERRNLRGSQWSWRPVEDLTTGDTHRSGGDDSCTDGCNEPAGNQEESLPQDHHPPQEVQEYPTIL